ncbi:hypothetical protein JHK85_004487 [Glycine max]|nr:hypothetical protein JHK85_004487 [Glycine max]
MSQHIRILPHPPLSSITPSTKPDSLPLCFSFGFRFGFHSSASPLISLSCGCAHQTPPVRLSPQQGSSQEEEESVFLYLQPISSENHFDRVLAKAQTLDEATGDTLGWRPCYDQDTGLFDGEILQFYSVDVNTVSHKLVTRAGVTLWRDSKKQGEVIGGHKAYLVINEVQEMIENECRTSFCAAE